jgi:hypothetical protein
MRAAAALALLALLAPPLAATTLLLGGDDELADRAEAIVVARVVASTAASDRPATEHRIAVSQVLKGCVEAEAVVRVPGGEAPGGLHLHVWGAPELRIGEPVLLFLSTAGDGRWEVLDLAAGAFHQRQLGGRRIAWRELGEVLALGKAGEPATVRDFDGFARWLEDRSRGVERPADYLLRLTGPAGKAAMAGKFSYLGGNRQRWEEFDRGEEVVWQADLRGEPVLPGGGFGELQTAMQAWVDDPDTNIAYRYDGTTSFALGGLRFFDGINAILFSDRDGHSAGTFTCTEPGRGSGVLATAGTWTTNGGRIFRLIVGADIVVNDGASCWFTTSARAEQVYAHELGHTLGLGHSCGDQRTPPCSNPLLDEAVMRATAHGDGRGAQLGEDDRAAIRSLYRPKDAPGEGLAPPVDLVAAAVAGSHVWLRWIDMSDDETRFAIEMKVGRGKFRPVGKAPRNATSAVVSGLAPDRTYTFRVRAANRKEVSEPSNEVKVTTR